MKTSMHFALCFKSDQKITVADVNIYQRGSVLMTDTVHMKMSEQPCQLSQVVLPKQTDLNLFKEKTQIIKL